MIYKERYREWCKKNKEHIKKQRKEYRQKNKERLKENKKEYYQKNKEHIKEQHKEWHQKNKQYNKEYQYKKKYNLTLEEIDQILIIQNHKCAICGKSLIETKRCTDHDHKTDKVRGILCTKCNLGLGHFNDDLDLLKKVIIYIESKGGLNEPRTNN